ncbi:MAG: hypothetical protein H6740_18205 [Alphaproteobacteria bacterium]|nr:hypothetical protein [Alphaproteobacteria bacterium]
MKPARVILFVEAALTVFSGLLAFADPEGFTKQFFDASIGWPGLYFVWWLACTYVVIGVLEFTLLRWGDPRSFRVAIPAISIGDVLHVGTHVAMLMDGGLVGVPTWISFGATAIFLTNRLLILRTPSLGTPPGPGTA